MRQLPETTDPMSPTHTYLRLPIAGVFVAVSLALFGCGEPLSGGYTPVGQAGTGSGKGGSSGSGSAGTAGVPAAGGVASGGTGGAPSGGAAGSAGSAGASSGGAAGAAASTEDVSAPSAGCGKVVLDQPGQYVEHPITVDTTYADQVNRRYFTKLPQNYDPNKPYPIVFYGPGCGGTGSEGTPIDGSIQNRAIFVFLLYTNACFRTGDENSPEIPYFGKALQEVQDNFCTDSGRVFVSGYSSGAWLSNLLACAHGDKIRAIGTAAGGIVQSHPPCKGKVAAIMHAGTGDNDNPIVNIDDQTGIDEGSGAARDLHRTNNGCGKETLPWDPMFPSCQVYQGCASGYPIVWCQENVRHSNGEEVSAQGFMKFWMSLTDP